MIATAPLEHFPTERNRPVGIRERQRTEHALEHGAWEICRVYLHPDQHGTGLAQALLDTAERHAIEAGATSLALWTDTRFLRAHRFYEKHGYVRAGAIRPVAPDVLEFPYAKPIQGIRRLDIAAAQSAERRLAEILVACVDDGASVSFLAPLAPDRARAFWQGVTRSVGQASTLLFAAWDQGALAGTIQLVLPASELGPHRAEVAKFLVHPAHRSRGLGAALLAQAEAAASDAGRTLLLLDTRPGDPAERLYRSQGWQQVGRIEGYTRDARGREEATLLFAKHTAPQPA